MNYPYLSDRGDSYWIAREEGYYCGVINKTCDLVDADWLRIGWHHEINWEGEWGKRDRIAFEKFISKLLLTSMVVQPTSSKRTKKEAVLQGAVTEQPSKLFPKVLRPRK